MSEGDAVIRAAAILSRQAFKREGGVQIRTYKPGPYSPLSYSPTSPNAQIVAAHITSTISADMRKASVSSGGSRQILTSA